MSIAAISLLIGLVIALAAMIIGAIRPAWAAWVGALAAAGAAGAVSYAWASGGGVIADVLWIPALGSRFILELDPLAAPLAVLMTGIAAPILAYTAAYLPKHLEHHGRPIAEQARFCRLMLLFMVAMVLLTLAQDLLVIFVALELTALTSFLLIEFDRENDDARRAAMIALVVTVGSSLLFLVGLLLVAVQSGTTVIPHLVMREPISLVAAVCLVLGVIGKSAQVPLHFWLPEAMRAPTPVSAYLHSAALVASGVFVLQRIRVLLEGAPEVFTLLFVIGFLSIMLGGALALISDKLKTILAYSTIAQYGYIVVLIALGTGEGFFGAPFFILAHGIAKAALFLTAGAVTITTGADKLSQTGGLARTTPVLAVAAAIAAAGIAGLPATIGYFKDELFFAAAVHHGIVVVTLSVIAATMTLAYMARFWWGIFMGSREEKDKKFSPILTGSVAFLAALVLLGGLWYAPLKKAFTPAGEVVGGEPVNISLGYHFDGRPEMWMAIAAWAAGLLLFLSRRRWEAPLSKLADTIAYAFGPAVWSDRLVAATHATSDWFYRFELRDLRDRVRVVLTPTAILVLLGLWAHGSLPEADGFTLDELPLAAGLILASGAALATLRTRRHITLLLVMTFVGFGLALTFALTGAPDVALVIAVIESALTTLFLAVIWQMRPEVLLRAQTNRPKEPTRIWFGIVAGAAAFVVSWVSLDVARVDSVAWAHVALTDSAHAKDVVTAILADFRGLDTAGELTVLIVAVLGAAAIRWEREE